MVCLVIIQPFSHISMLEELEIVKVGFKLNLSAMLPQRKHLEVEFLFSQIIVFLYINAFYLIDRKPQKF